MTPVLHLMALYGPAEPLEDGMLATPGHYVTQVRENRPILLCRNDGAAAAAAVTPVHWVRDPYSAMRWPIATARTHAKTLLDFVEYELSVVITRYGGDVAAVVPLATAATYVLKNRTDLS